MVNCFNDRLTVGAWLFRYRITTDKSHVFTYRGRAGLMLKTPRINLEITGLFPTENGLSHKLTNAKIALLAVFKPV